MIRILAVCLAMIVLNVPMHSAAAMRPDKLKAVFMLKLIDYISWPDNQIAKNLCVYEAESFAGLLETAAQLDTHSFKVMRIGSVEDVRYCDVIYTRDGKFKPITRGVLTVGESDGFANNGGMVEMHEQGDRVELIINITSIEKAALKANSHLLSLAEIVR